MTYNLVSLPRNDNEIGGRRGGGEEERQPSLKEARESGKENVIFTVVLLQSHCLVFGGIGIIGREASHCSPPVATLHRWRS